MTAFHETPDTSRASDRAAAMQALVPVIETERLLLRAPGIEDFARFADIMASPQGKNWGDPKDRRETWSLFVQITATWYLRGHGAWAICLREAPARLIGIVQIGAEPGDDAPELGWLLDAAAEGNGYATEAARAVRDHARDAMQMVDLVSYVDAENTRSRAVAERLDAHLFEPHDWAHHDTVCYRHLPPQAKPRTPFATQPNDKGAAR
ncbi:MAG: GNAT family N-acetyltransferase [Pseudomonadota bacterium]